MCGKGGGRKGRGKGKIKRKKRKCVGRCKYEWGRKV
jgi:hypothetical protein